MSSDSTQPEFKGTFSKQLTELRDFIEWLWKEHGMSYVKAGDDKVYAFGGNNHILVMDESKWSGLIEFVTPKGAITIKPAENNNFEVAGTDLDDKTIKEAITEGISQLRSHYEKRYWKTPQAAG
jgi:hypothetical protein